MTYNFDPDQWYDNEMAVLRASLKAGKITRVEFDTAERILDQRLEDMWQRIDGTYRLPTNPPRLKNDSDDEQPAEE